MRSKWENRVCRSLVHMLSKKEKKVLSFQYVYFKILIIYRNLILFRTGFLSVNVSSDCHQIVYPLIIIVIRKTFFFASAVYWLLPPDRPCRNHLRGKIKLTSFCAVKKISHYVMNRGFLHCCGPGVARELHSLRL